MLRFVDVMVVSRGHNLHEPGGEKIDVGVSRNVSPQAWRSCAMSRVVCSCGSKANAVSEQGKQSAIEIVGKHLSVYTSSDLPVLVCVL